MTANEIGISILNLRIDSKEDDVGWDFIEVMFDVWCDHIPQKDYFPTMKFVCADSGRTSRPLPFDKSCKIERTKIGLSITCGLLTPNSDYIIIPQILDENDNVVWEGLDSDWITEKTKRKPIEIIPIEATMNRKTGTIKIKLKTNGINQYCDPVKAMLRICGMCPCAEDYLGDCQTRKGINYYETFLETDGIIEQEFKIPESYRNQIKEYFVIFEYKTEESVEKLLQETPKYSINY